MRLRWLLVLLCLGVCACSRTSHEAGSQATSRLAADSAAIARDAPERIVMPLAPEGSGRMVVERVGVARMGVTLVAPTEAPLDLAPPVAEPGEPPVASAVLEPPDTSSLKPPIARGLPTLPRGGRGGRVTFDVRVNEDGEVSDVELVETDADSATVAAATRAAYDVRYHPALLGTQRVAVWCRQVFDVKRGR